MTKQTKLGINGFGRIGRLILRTIIEENYPNTQIFAINGPADPQAVGIASYSDAYDAAYFIVQASDLATDSHQISEGIIIDDYATCFGSKKAVDEFIEENSIDTYLRPDYRGGAWFVKPF